MHVTPILSPEGDRTGLVGTVEDITENRNMERQRQDAYEKTTLLLASATEARDPYTEHHLFRIRGYSVAIAQEMGLSPEISEEIGLAALLHDLGKTRVPDAILTKPGPLTEDEWQIMRRHTLWGEKLLPAIPGSRQRGRSRARITRTGTAPAIRTTSPGPKSPSPRPSSLWPMASTP